jgi:hypothetical protein
VSRIRDVYARAVVGPAYPPDERDLRDVRLFGLPFPLRASVAILATTAIVLVDQLGLLRLSATLEGNGLGLRAIAVERAVLFLGVPLVVVLAGFRDRPARYALALGDWRWGAGLLVAGLAVMTPIILGLAAVPSFREYYGAAGGGAGAGLPLATGVVNNLIELIPAEFLLRGFLMLALWRRIGPVALVVALVPFVLTHLGKPDIELWSTFVGGSVFAWLDWRTGSVLWSALGHVYVLSLMQVAVGGATV